MEEADKDGMMIRMVGVWLLLLLLYKCSVLQHQFCQVLQNSYFVWSEHFRKQITITR